MIYNPLGLKKSYAIILFKFISSYTAYVCERGYYMVDNFNIGNVNFSMGTFDMGYMILNSNGTFVRQSGSISGLPSYDTLKSMHDHYDVGDIGFAVESNNNKLLSRIKLLI